MHSDVLSRRFCGNGMPDWAVDDALEAWGMRPPYGDFPSPLPFPQSHFFGEGAEAADSGVEGGGRVCRAPSVPASATVAAATATAIAAVTPADVVANRSANGRPNRSGNSSPNRSGDGIGIGSGNGSGAVMIGWCAAELAAAAGARTSSEVAAVLGAAGLYPNLDACLERDFFSYYYTNVSTKTTMVGGAGAKFSLPYQKPKRARIARPQSSPATPASRQAPPLPRPPVCNISLFLHVTEDNGGRRNPKSASSSLGYLCCTGGEP
jgi:hypothetical protein